MVEINRTWLEWLNANENGAAAEPSGQTDATPVAVEQAPTSGGSLAAGNFIRAWDRDIKVVMRRENPSVVVLADVLSAEECDEVIRRSADRLQRSQVVHPENGERYTIETRTSENFWFAQGEDEFVENLERRMAALMNWPIENGEGLQVVHYGIGGEYQPHFDYFDPEVPGHASYLERGGQRVATLLIYLNDVEGGGETIFPSLGLSVVPRKGGAVYFHYLDSENKLDALTLHGGVPVARGEKWIMTKWIRERQFI
ncbi:2OG-Fe(II) oxygenase [Paraburkholderia bonniea]|uniref:2OG-Fe(II) oxygenase n=1 Tax=Paraburkholderia bonniea TaxID=2152891 RepID=UPI0012918F2E|nr:2OG-Fe(II) oxygenase [Paraburkholderia bonniea]WJF91634.1 2OG-Fe(II) oxygenase [Paraburkholderia bonniea]WJF94953.1 2OG-Fe(II) oxygenase [Paraburkholderia bonniea]